MGQGFRATLASRGNADGTRPLIALGLTLIANFVAGFDGELLGVHDDAQELDATLDYCISEGWFEGFWLRVRGSWINEETAGRDGSDVRVILRYDIPVI